MMTFYENTHRGVQVLSCMVILDLNKKTLRYMNPKKVFYHFSIFCYSRLMMVVCFNMSCSNKHCSHSSMFELMIILFSYSFFVTDNSLHS